MKLLKHSPYKGFNTLERIALKLVSVVVLVSCAVFAIFIHLGGKTTPGGGFQAGAILASGIVFYQFLDESSKIISQKILNFFISFGACLFIFTGAFSFFLGGQIFQYSTFHHAYGHVIGSFIVETGVFMVVSCGLMKIADAVWNY